MAFQMGEETRTFPITWDVSANKYKIESRGLRILTEGMKDKKIRGIRCHECDTVYIPGPFYCRKCHIEIDEVVEVKDTGTVMSFAVDMADIRGNPLPEKRISAMIKLDDCDAWFIGTVENMDWKDAKVGMRVKSIWVDEPQGKFSDIDHFEPI